MSKPLRIRNVNDYARYIGAPVLHPLVSIIHYDELTTLRHSLNSYDVYGMFLNDGVLPELTYGTVQYNMPRCTRIATRNTSCRLSPRGCRCCWSRACGSTAVSSRCRVRESTVCCIVWRIC